MTNTKITLALIPLIIFSISAIGGKDDGFSTPKKRRPRNADDIVTPHQQRDLDAEEALLRAPRKRRHLDLNPEEEVQVQEAQAVDADVVAPLAPTALDARFETAQILSDAETARIAAIVRETQWRGQIGAAFAFLVARMARLQPTACGEEIGRLGFMRFGK